MCKVGHISIPSRASPSRTSSRHLPAHHSTSCDSRPSPPPCLKMATVPGNLIGFYAWVWINFSTYGFING